MLRAIYDTLLEKPKTTWNILMVETIISEIVLLYGKAVKNAKEAPLSMTMPLLILAIVSIILGIYPRLVADFLILTISKFSF